MNTPTHLLVAAAAFGRPGRRPVTSAALIGGMLPDLSLYLLVAYERLALGRDFQTIFERSYFSPLWRGVFAVDNSAPLYAALLGLGLWLRRPWLWALAGAALLHIALDLPLHHDDGRAHFQPFTDWIYQSPVSYWDMRAYAAYVIPLEAALSLCLCWILWRRFHGSLAHAPIALGAALQIVALATWTLLSL
ncbi:MAG: cobalamin biosynthesis protein CobQ [Pseudomonadota bacterium]